jgi:hypothetical protein
MVGLGEAVPDGVLIADPVEDVAAEDRLDLGAASSTSAAKSSMGRGRSLSPAAIAGAAPQRLVPEHEVVPDGLERDHGRERLRAEEVNVLVISLGALLILGGVLFLANQAIRGGRLSGRWKRPTEPVGTLEPRERGGGFGLATYWPGFAMLALGTLLLLVRAAL